MRRIILTVLLLAALPASAQTTGTPRERALAAGYKAAFLCSDLFNAGMSEEQATAVDLTGIYREYEPLVAAMPATIDRGARTVSVTFDPKLPPRIAAWRPLVGCAQLPIGASSDAVAALPRITLEAPDLKAADARPWPLGNANATATLPRRTRAAVDAVLARAFEADGFGKGGRTSAVIVLKDGRIVAERYGEGVTAETSQRTWSVAKSLAAALVGRAAMLGKVRLDEPAPVPEWQAAGDPRKVLTFDTLLRMNSGLWTAGPGNRTDASYLGGSTVAETAAVMPLEAAPGSRFNYANNDILLAVRGLRARLGEDALAFPFRELLWPLGMTRTVPETDWRGDFILSSQVWMTARDLARLALLYQDDGVFAGKRLLPEGFVKASATPTMTQPPIERGGYGLGVWLYGARHGLPEGSIAMQGNRGQYAVIMPAERIVVVRRGFDATGEGFDPVRFAKEVRAVLGTAR